MLANKISYVNLDRLWLAVFGTDYPRMDSDTDEALRARLEEALSTLQEREVSILLRYYSVPRPTYLRVAEENGVSRERIRQIIAKAIYHLRQPTCARILRGLPPIPIPKPFEIADDTNISELIQRGWLGRRSGYALIRGLGFKLARRPILTVGATRHLSDARLLELLGFGPFSLAEVRRVCGPFEAPEILPEILPGQVEQAEEEDEDAELLGELGKALEAALARKPEPTNPFTRR